VKTITVKTQRAILVAMLRNYRRAVSNHRVARMVMMARVYFSDAKIRAIVQELILQDGCWHPCAEMMRQNQLFDSDSYEKLRKWAAEKRGLL
jgi:hypothetical protein